jgi:hypothetical protein
MSLEVLKHYEHAARKENPYTHLLQTKIPSLGTRYDCKIPDLLLTMQYRLDAKGHIAKEPKLTFQTDGPSDAILNFPHYTLNFDYALSVCRFTVSMDALFGEGVVNKQTATLSGTLGNEKPKAELQGGIEVGQDKPGTRTTLHARLEGMVVHKDKLLECWGTLI